MNLHAVQDTPAAWGVTRTQASIGEAVRVEARLELADGSRPEVGAWPEDPLVPWALLDAPTAVRQTLEGPLDAWMVGYTAMPLKGGELRTPELALTVGGSQVYVTPASLRVASELAEGEEAPRVLHEPLSAVTLPDQAGQVPSLLWLWGALPPLVAAVVWWRMRRTPRPVVAALPPAVQRLSELEQLWKRDRSAARECLHELVLLVRTELDQRTSVSRAALGGMEWADVLEREGHTQAAAFVRRIEPLRWCCTQVQDELVQARFDEARKLLTATTGEVRA
jgi:hypothetical protein